MCLGAQIPLGVTRGGNYGICFCNTQYLGSSSQVYRNSRIRILSILILCSKFSCLGVVYYIGFWMFLSFRIVDYNVFFRILDQMIGMFSLPEINEKKVLYALNFRGVIITIIIFIILSIQFHHLFFGTSQMLLPNSWLHLLSDADISKNHIRHKQQLMFQQKNTHCVIYYYQNKLLFYAIMSIFGVVIIVVIISQLVTNDPFQVLKFRVVIYATNH